MYVHATYVYIYIYGVTRKGEKHCYNPLETICKNSQDRGIPMGFISEKNIRPSSGPFLLRKNPHFLKASKLKYN